MSVSNIVSYGWTDPRVFANSVTVFSSRRASGPADGAASCVHRAAGSACRSHASRACLAALRRASGAQAGLLASDDNDLAGRDGSGVQINSEKTWTMSQNVTVWRDELQQSAQRSSGFLPVPRRQGKPRRSRRDGELCCDKRRNMHSEPRAGRGMRIPAWAFTEKSARTKPIVARHNHLSANE